jgi:hypothetical protein
LFDEYVIGKQTLTQLAGVWNISTRSVQRKLDQFGTPPLKQNPRPIVLILDALYFGGKDWLTREIVYYKFIQSEPKAEFLEVKNSFEHAIELSCRSC